MSAVDPLADGLAWSLARKGIVAKVEADPAAGGYSVDVEWPRYRGFVSRERLRQDGASLVARAIFRVLYPVEGSDRGGL